MNKEQHEAFAREAEKAIKTESDLNDFLKMRTKVTVCLSISGTKSRPH